MTCGLCGRIADYYDGWGYRCGVCMGFEDDEAEEDEG